MRRIPFVMGGALAVCVFSAPCFAGDTYIDINVTDKGNANYNTATITFQGDSTANVITGQYLYKVNSVSGDLNGLFTHMVGETIYTYCVDLFDNPNGTKTLDVYDLSDAPIPDEDDFSNMGSNASSLIGVLHKKYWDSYDLGKSSADAFYAAAFQLAIWEIAYESENIDWSESSAGAAGYDVFDDTSGSGFKVDGSDLGWRGQAQDWIAAAYADWKNGVRWRPLYAAGSETVVYQDFILIPIPLPAPIALAGIGLIGVLAGRRRLARLVK